MQDGQLHPHFLGSYESALWWNRSCGQSHLAGYRPNVSGTVFDLDQIQNRPGGTIVNSGSAKQAPLSLKRRITAATTHRGRAAHRRRGYANLTRGPPAMMTRHIAVYAVALL